MNAANSDITNSHRL